MSSVYVWYAFAAMNTEIPPTRALPLGDLPWSSGRSTCSEIKKRWWMLTRKGVQYRVETRSAGNSKWWKISQERMPELDLRSISQQGQGRNDMTAGEVGNKPACSGNCSTWTNIKWLVSRREGEWWSRKRTQGRHYEDSCRASHHLFLHNSFSLVFKEFLILTYEV